ncbi:DEAD/DEAH box helicase [Marasmitruncus massiliensis]|uniref:DEAD/DEAH box helicase n=1 Tax=Marasmitruncus massiliensis TaxID=1944642 RepID=UPI000C7D5093|nr:DEAD/DEAH box helicase [Marasmitruncus massiliensis]
MKFEELQLIEPILRAVQDEGYTNPSPIQEQAIPPALAGRDVLGCAQTGTGKTAAFAIPILQHLTAQKLESGRQRVIRALILTPTRELALQICDSFKAYGHYLRLRTAVIFGGVSQNPQVDELKRGIDILVATPGRLNDLIGQGYIDLQNVETLVLDEADRMLDMGFIHDVEKVITRVPSERQTLFFSATMPDSIMRLCNRILTDPVKVAVTPVSSTVDLIEQALYYVDKTNKRKLLLYLLKNPALVSVLVFTFTKHGADRVVRELEKGGVHAQAIHGNKSQNARQNALNAFKNGDIRVLVATDIAARGIDIDELSHVINYDLPNIPETYVHRIGRTGRAGLGGTAISFCCFDEKESLAEIEKLIGKKIPVVEDHPFPMEIFVQTPKQPRQPRQRIASERGKQLSARKTADGVPTKPGGNRSKPKYSRKG